jgi:hypothetical protein
MDKNDVNIHVVDFNKASLLIKAAGLTARTNPMTKKLSEE